MRNFFSISFSLFIAFAVFCGCEKPASRADSEDSTDSANNDESQTDSKNRASATGEQTEDLKSLLPKFNHPLSPEDTFRTFMIATLIGDVDTLQSVSLPHEELDLLINHEPIPEAMKKALIDQAKTLKLRRFKIGETIEFYSGKKIVFDQSSINENRVVFDAQQNPVPVVVVLENQTWKVDPSPIIIFRKAANKTREQRQNK